jgi:hypothetical protein
VRRCQRAGGAGAPVLQRLGFEPQVEVDFYERSSRRANRRGIGWFDRDAAPWSRGQMH